MKKNHTSKTTRNTRNVRKNRTFHKTGTETTPKSGKGKMKSVFYCPKCGKDHVEGDPEFGPHSHSVSADTFRQEYVEETTKETPAASPKVETKKAEKKVAKSETKKVKKVAPPKKEAKPKKEPKVKAEKPKAPKGFYPVVGGRDPKYLDRKAALKAAELYYNPGKDKKPIGFNTLEKDLLGNRAGMRKFFVTLGLPTRERGKGRVKEGNATQHQKAVKIVNAFFDKYEAEQKTA